MEKLHKRILIVFIAYLFTLNVLSFASSLNPKQLINPFFVKNRTTSIYYLTKHILFESGLAVSPVQKEKVDALVDTLAVEHGIDPELVKLVIEEESHYNQFAISRAGAMGLMQLMPTTFADINSGDPFAIEDNIKAGIIYLAQQIKRFKTLDLALSAYNAGPSLVSRINRIPYVETEIYVRNILSRYGKETATDTVVAN